MLKKELVFLYLLLFFISFSTISKSDNIFEFDPNNLDIALIYKRSYAPLYEFRCTTNYRENITVEFINKTIKYIYRLNTNFIKSTLSASTPIFRKSSIAFYEEEVNGIIESALAINNLGLTCPGDTKKVVKSLDKAFSGDFNGDGFRDLLFLPQHSSLKSKAYIFNSFNTSKLEYYEYKPSHAWFVPVPKFTYFHDISSIVPSGWQNAQVTIQDRNKDGRDDLLITRPDAPDLIAFAAPDGSFHKAEVDTGIGKFNGPSLYKSRFCNRALLTQHPNQNPSTVLFDDICQTAYVSPPQFGQAEVTQLTPNPEKQALCPAFVGVLDKKQKILDDLVSVANRYTENVASLEVDDSLAVYSAAKREAQKQLTKAEQQESSIRLQLESAQLALAESSFALEICGNCSAEQTAVNNAKTQVNALKQQLDQAVLARRDKQQTYDEALVTYQQERERLIQLDIELMALLADYEALKQKETALFSEYASAEGATAQVRYPLNWPAQINHYQQRNARLGVNWQPLPLTGLKLIARLPEHPETPMGNKNLSLPYVLYANINDTLTGYEPSLMPAGNTVINSTLRNYPTDSITVPNALTGTVGISLGGYCSLYAPENNQPVNHQQIAQQVAPTLHYEYEQQVKRGYTAKYKLDTFVKTIVRTKKKKKWFKKKKKTYIERKVITKDWFDIKFDATSGEYAYSPAQQDQITREVKLDLVRRVNTAIGALYADNSHCKNNQDCSYGYWLGQLASNVDDTRAIQQFKQGNSKWVEETVYGIRYQPKTGWVGFR